MSYFVINPRKQWRQTWQKVTNGVAGNSFFYTWHRSHNSACSYVYNYLAQFGTRLPDNYFKPVGTPSWKSNLKREPFGDFVRKRTDSHTLSL